MELNGLAVRLQGECNPDTCTQMTATDQWIFLCAAHKQPKECPSIDYTRHTLDGAACLLNSNKYFPSRVSIKEASVDKLGSVCRRVYRIFSHAYFHHRPLFDEYENETQYASSNKSSTDVNTTDDEKYVSSGSGQDSGKGIGSSYQQSSGYGYMSPPRQPSSRRRVSRKASYRNYNRFNFTYQNLYGMSLFFENELKGQSKRKLWRRIEKDMIDVVQKHELDSFLYLTIIVS